MCWRCPACGKRVGCLSLFYLRDGLAPAKGIVIFCDPCHWSLWPLPHHIESLKLL